MGRYAITPVFEKTLLDAKINCLENKANNNTKHQKLQFALKQRIIKTLLIIVITKTQSFVSRQE